MFWWLAEESPDGSAVEKFMLVVAQTWLRRGDFVLELGANHGQHSRIFARAVGDEGRVVCVEADPDLAEALRRGANQSTARIEIVHAAAGDASQQGLTFYRHRERDQEGSLIMRESIDKYEALEVPGTSIDELIGTGDLPSFVKIDVEGGEYSVLAGADGLLRRGAPLVACELQREFAPHLNYDSRSFIGLVRSYGWSLYSLDGQRVTEERWESPDFKMNYQCWLVREESRARAFITETMPGLVRAFAWGGSPTPPYPFHLADFPVVTQG